MQIMEQAREYLEQVKELAGDEHRAARRALYEALPEQVRLEARRIHKAAFFVPEHADLARRKAHLSPSGQYKLVVTPYTTGPNSWEYSQGLVYHQSSDQPIAEVQRNYRAFPFAWVEGHEKGDFLICGEDYQGQTVIDLRTKARRDHLPSIGFCWAGIHPSPDGKLLAVEGCFWAAPYEVRFYDFSEPLILPWTELSNGGNYDSFFGWLSNDRASIGGWEDYYVPLNKSESELHVARRNEEITVEEYERYRDDDANWEDRKAAQIAWVKPSPLDCLKDYAKERFEWRRKKGVRVSQDEQQNTRALIDRLSPDERAVYGGSDLETLVNWALRIQG